MSFIAGFNKEAAPLARKKSVLKDELTKNKQPMFPKGKDVESDSVLDGPAGSLIGGRRYVTDFQ